MTQYNKSRGATKIIKATGADELQGGAETTVSVHRWQERHPSAAYNYLMGRHGEDTAQTCITEGQNTSHHEDSQIPEYCP